MLALHTAQGLTLRTPLKRFLPLGDFLRDLVFLTDFMQRSNFLFLLCESFRLAIFFLF